MKDRQQDTNMKLKTEYVLNTFAYLDIPLVIFEMTVWEYYATYLNTHYRSYVTIFYADKRDPKYSARIKQGSNIAIDLSDSDMMTEQVLISTILEYKIPTLPLRPLYPLVNLFTPVCGLHFIAEQKFIFDKILDKLSPKDLRSLSRASEFLRLKMRRFGNPQNYYSRVLMNRTLY